MPKKPADKKATVSSQLTGTVRGGWLDGKRMTHASGGKAGVGGRGAATGKAGVKNGKGKK